MTCLFSSYKRPPINTKNRIYKGPALPITDANAIHKVKAILNAPVAVAPRVLKVSAEASEIYIIKSAPCYSNGKVVPVAEIVVI